MRELIAILRGIQTEEVVDAVNILLASGITKIEIPLNSPDPYASIDLMVRTFKGQGIFGAGTVTDVSEVGKLHDIGAQMIVSPNCDPDIIKATKAAGMLSYPGVMTPSECFLAIKSGATGLKFFPGDLVGPKGLKAMRAVLPADMPCIAVGGAGPQNFREWIEAGATGFGIGSALYKAGMDMQQLRKNTVEIVNAYDEALS